MKYTILLFFIIMNAAAALAQTTDTSKSVPQRQMTEQERAAYDRTFRNIEHPPAYYNLSLNNQMGYDINMYKAKSYKTKGWILLSAGIALAAIGFAVPNTADPDYTKPVFFGIGAASATVGAVCFIISGGKKKKAQAILKTGMQSPASSALFRPELGIRIVL